VTPQSELPQVPQEASRGVVGAIKTYRKAMQIAESRARAAEKQQKFLAGQLAQSKENEAKTYGRLIEALQLLGEYRLMFRTQSEASNKPNVEDIK